MSKFRKWENSNPPRAIVGDDGEVYGNVAYIAKMANMSTRDASDAVQAGRASVGVRGMSLSGEGKRQCYHHVKDAIACIELFGPNKAGKPAEPVKPVNPAEMQEAFENDPLVKKALNEFHERNEAEVNQPFSLDELILIADGLSVLVKHYLKLADAESAKNEELQSRAYMRNAQLACGLRNRVCDALDKVKLREKGAKA